MSIIEEIVGKMKNIQSDLLEFLEDGLDSEDKYDNFINLLSTQQIINDQYEFKALMQLINSIGKNHQRVPNFIFKIERLLKHFKTDIQKYFSNSEIFRLFESNKRILLFLIEENMILIDEYIFSQITKDEYIKKKYGEYFSPELKPFLTEELINKYGNKNKSLKKENFMKEIKKEVPSDFYDKRKKGENDDFLCQLIRFNEIKEFVTFVEQTNLSLESKIKRSIFETNQLLIDNEEISLIEYASFYGSNDIIKYMQMKGVELTSSMWIYAIHSRNAELIRYLEDNHVSPPENNFDKILEESIKCHHNEISNYIIDYLIKEEDLHNNIEYYFYDNLYRYAVKYCNYCFFPENMKYKNMFFYLCEFDYYTLVKLYLEEGNIDINSRNI